MDKEITILVVTHKMALIPANDLYVPILVGPNKESIKYENYFTDDTGINIAEKNETFCELTALYWAWKNLDSDYIGLVHYRRYFMSKIKSNNIIKIEELASILSSQKIVLPKKRNYFIETTKSHYEHNHNIKDLLAVQNIIKEYYPNYLPTFENIMGKRSGHRFNMMIMKKEKLDEYCSWLFDILFKLEQVIDISQYDEYQKRVYGFLSERLLDVWIMHNDEEYEELPFKFTEHQNWLKKGGKFLVNKLK